MQSCMTGTGDRQTLAHGVGGLRMVLGVYGVDCNAYGAEQLDCREASAEAVCAGGPPSVMHVISEETSLFV